MRTIAFIFFVLLMGPAVAQRACSSFAYYEASLKDPAVAAGVKLAEQQMAQNFNFPLSSLTRTAGAPSVIRIPVVVHVVYQNALQNISDAQVQSQIDVLNQDFRRENSDTANTPDAFRNVAADVAIEFVLATADPEGRPTTGIIRKQTSVGSWQLNDKIKHAMNGGSDGWDSKRYLNIWVGNLDKILGYASFPGGRAEDDGIVIAYDAFGTINVRQPYNLGRTAVHEAGHWLGLKHIWGDASCGDDEVYDTPKQSSYTVGCPSTFRSSCNNGPAGDMFMNYMDFTNDACLNLFTEGQKSRMRSLFNADGFRNGLLFSRGLDHPWMPPAEDIGLPLVEKLSLYPNPASASLELNFDTHKNWVGKELQITNVHGIVVQRFLITSTRQTVNISRLQAGVYFLQGQSEGKKISEKFVKL
jgi:hypothetical protein